jgi:hypothetical protein
LGQAQAAEVPAGKHRFGPTAFHHRQAECFLAVAPALGELPKLAQGAR